MEIESPYGSDNAGLVCGYLFKSNDPGHAVESATAGNALAQWSGGSGEFLWLHFALTHVGSEQWLRRHLDIPEDFYELMKATRSSTRIEVSDGALLGVINDVGFFSTEGSAAATMILYVTDRIMVSARTTQLRSVDRLRSAVKRGESFRSPADLLAHLLRDQADVLVEIVRDATGRVDAIEDRILAHQFASRAEIAAMRRMLVRLQRLLAPEPAALFRLLTRPPVWLAHEDVIDLRQSAEEFAAAVADSVALVERMRLLQEELMAITNEQTNNTLFVLTVVTVLALPLTIVPGMFGMNVGGIPFSQHASGFWVIALSITGAVTAAGALAWSHYRGRLF